jgi:hypothetical protein
MGFYVVTYASSHRRSVLKLLYRTLHGLLGIPRLICLFRPVCLSLFYRSDCLRFFFSRLTLPPFVDSLDSELWYRFRCRAAALTSGSTLAVGQVFSDSFSPRGPCSKGDR